MKMKQIIIGIILITIGILLDQFTKWIVFKNLELGKQYDSIPGFKIYLVYNDGAAFGILANKMWFLILISFVAFGLFTYLMKDFDLINRPIYSVALVLLISGTFGNFIDRILFNRVRDFIEFSFVKFATFNIADVCLTFGVILLAIDILFGETGARWTK